MFKDRKEAASMLATRLRKYKGQKPLVLAIPRGGVPMGKIIADALEGDLDVILVHKLGHPENPEYAVGAIDEDGQIYLNADAMSDAALLSSLRTVETSQLKRLKNLREQYTPLKSQTKPGGRTVIVVDDGIATGWTIKAAIAWLRRAKAKAIVIAVPVGPIVSIDELRADSRVSEVFCLKTPQHFAAVGQFYQDFSQVTDEEVAQILAS